MDTAGAIFSDIDPSGAVHSDSERMVQAILHRNQPPEFIADDDLAQCIIGDVDASRGIGRDPGWGQ